MLYVFIQVRCLSVFPGYLLAQFLRFQNLDAAAPAAEFYQQVVVRNHPQFEKAGREFLLARVHRQIPQIARFTSVSLEKHPLNLLACRIVYAETAREQLIQVETAGRLESILSDFK